MQSIVPIQIVKLKLPSSCIWKRICIGMVSIISMQAIQAQDFGNNSSIWGNSSNQNVISTPLQDDATWGTLPSQQTLNSIRNNSERNNSRRRTPRDVYGNPILTDANGNIVYDSNGNPAIDSIALSQSSFLDPNDDPASLPPPPEDPADVPIDGGIAVLLIVGLGVGYKNRKIITKEDKCMVA